MKSCEHFPKAKNQGQSHDLQYTQNKSVLHTADICAYCQEPIWFYYQKQENQVTFGQLKKGFENFSIADFEWKVVLNQQFTKDTEIGGTYDQSYIIKESGKITYLIDFNSPENKYCPPDRTVLKYKKVVCKHERVSGGLCVFCLTDVRTLKNMNFRRYLFQFDYQNFNPSVLLSGNALQDQAEQFKRKLLKQKKGMLILDLDNTILHSISSKRVGDDMLSQIDEYKIIPPQQNPSIFIEKTLVKFRPNFQYFLNKIIGLYEIFIYTKGTRLYAEQICRAVRNRYPQLLEDSKNFMPHRIISRDQDPNLIKKNLDYIIPKNRDFMLILDDRRDVWNHSSLCIFTKPYIYFYFVAVTQDGKTKLQPVEWEKGGGTLEHKFNSQEQKCLQEILNAEEIGLEEVAEQKFAELKEEIEHQDQKIQKIVIQCGQQQNLPQSKDKKQQQTQIPQESKSVQGTINEKKVDANHNAGKQLKHNAKVPDQFLITTTFALMQAHTIYFNKLEMNNDEQKKQGRFADLSFCFHEYKKTILDHISAYFLIRDYKKSGVFRRAQKLGLRILENTQEKIDIIIRPNNFMQGFSYFPQLANKYYSESIRKIKSIGQARNIPIVSQSWIDACYEFNCCLHYSYFQPNNSCEKIIYSTQAQFNQIVNAATGHAAQKIKQILEEGTGQTKLSGRDQ